MKLAMIGFGQAGGKIVDRFVAYDKQTRSDVVSTSHAINTAETDLMGLTHIPPENRLLVGQERVKGNGVGADNELGAEITEQNLNEIRRAVDPVAMHKTDAFLVVAGLGGGTGSGGGPVLARELKKVYSEPVYALGVLPAQTEGTLYSLNAARSLRTFRREADNVLLFDNNAWRKTGESLASAYAAMNEELVRRFGVLFAAGEPTENAVAENVVDTSEIVNTLAGGEIATVGYAAIELDRPSLRERLRLWLRGETDAQFGTAEATNRVTRLVREAALSRLTMPCDIGTTRNALMLLAGPSAYHDRKGIERGRMWLEEETGAVVRGGDFPVSDTKYLASVLLFSGLQDAPRLRKLYERAIEAREEYESVGLVESDSESLTAPSDERL